MDPIDQLRDWLDAARAAREPDPQAMSLATVSADGVPSVRTVSMKELDGRGLVFTTSLASRKARELELTGRAAASFWWPRMRRQARVAATAERLPRADDERLFATRPRPHQLATIASPQGEPIDDLEPLRERAPLECPPDFGGFRLVPHVIEFWEERSDRLHERVEHRRGAGGWSSRRLAP
jgi:pyridoxamine 5'-phosphate oxidase